MQPGNLIDLKIKKITAPMALLKHQAHLKNSISKNAQQQLLKHYTAFKTNINYI
jgi:hypothetical protein